MPYDDCSRAERCPPCINEEPPMSSEEEEEAPEDEACTCGVAGDGFVPLGHYKDCPQAPEDWHCMHKGGCTRLLEGVCQHGCRDAADELTRSGQEMEPPPPQPDRRPPYAVAYSVNGHLYEVAVSGDAAVRSVDGALVIQHHLGPVAGIVQVLPVINKEAPRGAEADQ